jgi:hypothetical protein
MEKSADFLPAAALSAPAGGCPAPQCWKNGWLHGQKDVFGLSVCISLIIFTKRLGGDTRMNGKGRLSDDEKTPFVNCDNEKERYAEF